ncbi:MAG: hypothetical protein EPO40_18790 [Myxococcaceae bacterium]|nr:MAG: hypothetical protein EPO40_18790 [Myxococcaceae bacterium]
MTFRAQHGIRDTPEWHAEREKEERDRKAREDLYNQLMPRCPNCNKQMTVRERGSDRRKFFGCAAFPKCKGTREGDSAIFLALEERRVPAR